MALLLWAWAAPPALALDSYFRMADYRHDVWGAKEGAPPMITAMAQTRDGWMWFASTRGLYRFDGVSFELFAPLPGEALLFNKISTMAAAPNGDLLIAYLAGGFSILRQGHLLHTTSVGQQPFGSAYAVIADTDGTYWVGASDGLWHLRGSSWDKVGKDWALPVRRVTNMVLDQYGRLLLTDGTDLFLLDRAQRKFVSTGYQSQPGRGPGLGFSPDGQLWMRSVDTLTRIDLPQSGPVLPRAAWANPATLVTLNLFDREGNLWSPNCPERLCMIRRAALPATASFNVAALPAERLGPVGQASGQRIYGMLEDRDGNIWLGTASGVERLRQNRLATIPYPEASIYTSIALDPAGAVMAALGDKGKLYRVDGAALVAADTHSGTALLHRGLEQAVLLGTPDALVVQRAGAESMLPWPDGATAQLPRRLLQEAAGSYWAGLAGKGISRYHDGVWSTSLKIGLPPQNAAMASNGDGHVWLSYPNNRILDFHAGSIRQYGAEDGVDVRIANFIDVQREVLISGDGGFQVLQGQRFRHLHTADPALLSGITGVVIGPNQDRWLHGPTGVLHVAAADWQATMADPSVALRYELLDQLDGYPGTAQFSNTSTSVATADGRLWFAATGGIAVYDPRHDRRATAAPAPMIRGLIANGERFQPLQAIRLPPGTERLTIEYTALNSIVPERTRYRYRLHGIDRDWQSATALRDISYANLGPGKYTFALQAATGGNAWSAQQASIDFDIQPRFVQTWWFMLLCAVGLVALLFAGHRLHVRRVTANLHALHRERNRIARTLHDTFLQSLQALVWRFDSLKRGLPMEHAHARLLDRTMEQADALMAEGRRQILDLRPNAAPSTLEERLEMLIASLRLRTEATIGLTAPPPPHPLLLPTVANEAYHIAHEAMLNAINHGPLTSLEIAITYQRACFTLAVTDNGSGIDQSVLAGGRAGHWGLAGMRERGSNISGKVSIVSRRSGTGTDSGTTVALHVPARAAYVKSGRYKS